MIDEYGCRFDDMLWFLLLLEFLCILVVEKSSQSFDKVYLEKVDELKSIQFTCYDQGKLRPGFIFAIVVFLTLIPRNVKYWTIPIHKPVFLTQLIISAELLAQWVLFEMAWAKIDIADYQLNH